jgi:hypothetical protein
MWKIAKPVLHTRTHAHAHTHTHTHTHTLYLLISDKAMLNIHRLVIISFCFRNAHLGVSVYVIWNLVSVLRRKAITTTYPESATYNISVRYVWNVFSTCAWVSKVISSFAVSFPKLFLYILPPFVLIRNVLSGFLRVWCSCWSRWLLEPLWDRHLPSPRYVVAFRRLTTWIALEIRVISWDQSLHGLERAAGDNWLMHFLVAFSVYVPVTWDRWNEWRHDWLAM